MKPNIIILFVLAISPSLALNKDCLILSKEKSRDHVVHSTSATIPMRIFLSLSEKLIIQIAFKGFENDIASDYLEVSSKECIAHKKRNLHIQTENLNCSTITQGWHEADIMITPTSLVIGSFLNYSLSHKISHLLTTANYAVYCKENSPTWEIMKSIPIEIPLTGEENVNITVDSNEKFSPILHILGNSVSLSWKKESIAMSDGPPLPKGQYFISICNKSEGIILNFFSEKSGKWLSISNIGEPLEKLGISSSNGIFSSILNINNSKVICKKEELNLNNGEAEVNLSNLGEPLKELKEKKEEHNSKETMLIAVSTVLACVTLGSVLLLVFIVKRYMPTIQNRTNDLENQPLLKHNDDKIRKKVDIKEIVENFSLPSEPTNKFIQTYRLKLEKDHHDSEKKVQKLSLGLLCPDVPTKSILILGETGIGKSTTINSLVNHIYGIKIEDEKRFCLIETNTEKKRDNLVSQTEFMTAYVLPYQNGMPNNCNYIIIDTPGFGDTRGFERDKEIMLQLKNFLKQDYNLSHIDVVGLVVKASAPRLTIAQRYIYEGLFSMFGKDISHNIFLLITFAAAEVPTVLKVLKDADIQYHHHFKLNNDSLYRAYTKIGENIDLRFENPEIIRINWEMTEKSLQNLFQEIEKINPVSLSLTKIVLEENTRLHSVVGYLQKQIKEGLDKMTELKAKQIESMNPEDTKLLELEIRHTEDLLVVSIQEAQELTERLKEIPLKLDPLSVHGYIEVLISNEEKEMQPHYEERIRTLQKLNEENNVLKAVINKEQTPAEGWLNYFQKLKEE